MPQMAEVDAAGMAAAPREPSADGASSADLDPSERQS